MIAGRRVGRHGTPRSSEEDQGQQNRAVNKFQLTVLIAAMANLALLLLFPPFDSQPLGRIGPANFDAFYPVFDWPAKGTLNSGLLYLEIFPVLINAALAWLLLQGTPQQPFLPRVRWQSVLQWLVIADLFLILIFPPFETLPLAARMGERAFEGFRFVLSGSVQRGIFLPLLFLELLLLALNATALWLAFGLVARADETIGVESPGAPGQEGGQMGRSASDRRQRRDPHYDGPERRSGIDRRERS
jgi:hypothetical protein